MPTSSALAAFCCAVLSSVCVTAPANVTQSSFAHQPQQMSNGTLYSISAFSPKVFVRTDEFELNYKSCVQFSFKLMESKVRLRAYTCLLSEGGFCTLDKFAFPKHRDGCAYLRPWLFYHDRYSFYFALERRPRKYHSVRNKHSRILKRNEQLSTAAFGHLELNGIIPCERVCGRKEDNNRTS